MAPDVGCLVVDLEQRQEHLFVASVVESVASLDQLVVMEFWRQVFYNAFVCFGFIKDLNLGWIAV